MELVTYVCIDHPAGPNNHDAVILIDLFRSEWNIAEP